MTFHDFLTRALAKGEAWLPWTLPIKLLLGGIFGALGGAGVLGFLSEYATYSYAINYGFRPPLEGTPYLKAAVRLGSFFLLLTGALVFVISILILRFCVGPSPYAGLAAWLSRATGIERLSMQRGFISLFLRQIEDPDRSMRRTLFYGLIGGLVGATFLFVGFVWDLEGKSTRAFPSWKIFAGMGVYGFAVTVSALKRDAIKWVGGIATACYFATWLVVLFNPSVYAQFLRAIGYGGGIAVVVELREPATVPDAQPITGNLLLRTSEALLLWIPESRRIVEIPHAEVKEVQHEEGGLRALPFHLPSKPREN